MKRTYPMTVRQIIDTVVSDTDSADIFLEQRACYLWPELVGPGVNRYTTRRYVEHGFMHVYMSSAPLKNELMFHREALIERMNRIIGKNVIVDILIH